MSKPVQCHDCASRFECRCGVQPDGTYFYDYKHHSHFGLGAIRCAKCANLFQEANRIKKQIEEAMSAVLLKAHIASDHQTECDTCQECCCHDFDPDEGYMCLNCGKEGFEDAVAHAYDRAKDLRKYGDT